MNLVLILILAISSLCVLFAPWIMKFIVPGFSPEKFKETVNLTRIMFLSPVLLSVSGIFSGILTTFRRFFVYSLAPVFYNLGIILGIYVFTSRFGIIGLALAVVAGAFLHMLVQLPAAFAVGFRPNFHLDLKNPAIKKIGLLMLPRSLSLMVQQFNFLFITIIASTLMAGSLAVFNLANNIAGIPLTIFGAPFAIAVFPELALSFNRQKMKRFIDIFSTAFVRISFFVIPSIVVILVLRAQLVRIILGTGRFDWQDTTLTFQVLGFLALSLFFQSLIPLVSRAFFALHNTFLPFVSGLIAALLNILLAFVLSREYGIIGIALAFSVSQAAYLTFMFVTLYVKVKGFRDHLIISAIIKITIASTAAGVAIQTVKHFIGVSLGTETFFKVLMQTLGSSLTGALIFFFVVWYFGLKEINTVRSIILKLLKR